MSRWAALAFVVLGVAMFTGVLEPLTHGRDDSWAILVVPVAATIGLAYAVRGWRMLFGPAALAFAGFVAVGDDPIAMVGVALMGAPALMVIAAVAVYHARRRERDPRAIVIGAFAVAALPLLWGASEVVRRGPELPRAVQAQLPLDESLSGLCDGPPGERSLRPKADALLRELRERPRSMVRFTRNWPDAPQERDRMTVREVAEEQLGDLANARCEPQLQRRLRDAL